MNPPEAGLCPARETRGPGKVALPRALERRLAGVTLGLALAGCAAMPPPSPGLTDTLDVPAQRALFDGMRAYEDGQYPVASRALRQALSMGLSSARDRAAAHKLLAFIHCSSERYAECEAQFRAARQADPRFALAPAELAHPLWGPVYRRVVPAR